MVDSNRTPIRLAIPIWMGRISPVYDVARRLCIVDLSHGRALGRSELAIAELDHLGVLLRLRVQLLLCGGISKLLEIRIQSVGIDVRSRLRGTVDEIVEAYLEDRLDESRYRLPRPIQRREGRDTQTQLVP